MVICAMAGTTKTKRSCLRVVGNRGLVVTGGEGFYGARQQIGRMVPLI